MTPSRFRSEQPPAHVLPLWAEDSYGDELDNCLTMPTSAACRGCMWSVSTSLVNSNVIPSSDAAGAAGILAALCGGQLFRPHPPPVCQDMTCPTTCCTVDEIGCPVPQPDDQCSGDDPDDDEVTL